MDKMEPQKSIMEKRVEAQKKMEEATNELRKCISIVLKTEEGVRFFQYLYRLLGGENEVVRMDSNGRVDMNQTLVLADRKDIYTQIRRHVSTDKLMQIEKHNWEIREGK